MNKYHFSVGNSTNGPVGYCATVVAESEDEALNILRQNLPHFASVDPFNDDPAVEYIQVYFNEEALSVADIEEVDEEVDL